MIRSPCAHSGHDLQATIFDVLSNTVQFVQTYKHIILWGNGSIYLLRQALQGNVPLYIGVGYLQTSANTCKHYANIM